MQEIKERVDEVDEHVVEVDKHIVAVDKHVLHETSDSSPKVPAGDDGRVLISERVVKSLALFLVVLLTAFAAFTSQKTSNKVQDNSNKVSAAQASQSRFVACNGEYLAKTIAALNARTANTAAQNAANVTLQKAQSKFLGIFVLKPPVTPEQGLAALKMYLVAQNTFFTTSATTKNNVKNNPYPTSKDFQACLDKK